ncbi:MAG: hypothetical protein HY926_12640 [Elusimicrobia bacterium]|nr:hypothetical protein [Elusimicrobiota bacterium]
MDSIVSLNYRELSAGAAKAALPAGLLAALAGAAALRLWPGGAGRGAALGLAAAWILASLGAAALLAARQVSARAFWLAFWTGIGSRLAVLVALMLWCLRSPQAAADALLAGYGVGVACLLPIELRQVRLR